MLNVVTVSSSREREAAEALAELIRRAWPGVESSQHDRVTIAAGIKLVRESDLLVVVELAAPRATGDLHVQSAVIVIEAKSLDISRFEQVGNDLRPSYGRKPSRETVLEQLKSQVDGLVSFFNNYGGDRCFIHSLAWLRGVTSAELAEKAPGLSHTFVGSDATWEAMLSTAARENAAIGEALPENYHKGIAFMRDKLCSLRRLSTRDHTKLDFFTTEALQRDVLDGVLEKVGRAQIRLVGRAGSGKSTTLALLAKRVAEVDQARVLFLTYHRVLRGELDHFVRSLAESSGLSDDAIVVRSMHELIEKALEEFGMTLPRTPAGAVDYVNLPAEARTFLNLRGTDALRTEAKALQDLDPQTFRFDYVFVDEAQDWRGVERDILRLFFDPVQTVLGDGVDQFAQRQSRCDWVGDVPKEMRFTRELTRSLRMSENVARFVNAFARSAGCIDWSVKSHRELSGGRIILHRSAADPKGVLQEVLDIACDAGVAPGDCLVATPPKHADDGNPATEIRAAAAACGVDVWDASDTHTRLLARQPEQLPIVPYGSLRGLEGWATVLFGLDDFYANKLRYPNLEPSDNVTPQVVARNAMLLAVTRAAHVLVIVTSDDASPVSQWLQEAAEIAGRDVVETR